MSFPARAGHSPQTRNPTGGRRDDGDDRQEPLDRTLRALRGDADDRARRHRRERRAALDPGRSRVLAVEPRLGRQRLSDRLRRPAAAVRALRRHPRTQERLPRRTRRLHRRLAPLRRGTEPGAARRGPLHPGRRRRDDLRRDPRHDRHDVPRAARAGEGDRRLRVRRIRRRLDRAARRRRAHAVDQLALDLLRQHPDRHRDRVLGAAADREGQGHRVRRGSRHPRRRADHRRADAARVHDRQARGRGRLGLERRARAGRRSRWRCSPRSSCARRAPATR